MLDEQLWICVEWRERSPTKSLSVTKCLGMTVGAKVLCALQQQYLSSPRSHDMKMRCLYRGPLFDHSVRHLRSKDVKCTKMYGNGCKLTTRYGNIRKLTKIHENGRKCTKMDHREELVRWLFSIRPFVYTSLPLRRVK